MAIVHATLEKFFPASNISVLMYSFVMKCKMGMMNHSIFLKSKSEIDSDVTTVVLGPNNGFVSAMRIELRVL